MINFEHHSSVTHQYQEEREDLVYQDVRFEVLVDRKPIGGFRGECGTLSIRHLTKEDFTTWDDSELENLARLIQKILKIQEDAHVMNTLIFAKQEDHRFKLSLVPYPRCNWIEKIQGLIHVIFDPPCLRNDQVKKIADFYRNKIEIEGSKIIPFWEKSHTIKESRKPEGDPFCRESVINKQIILNYVKGKNYGYGGSPRRYHMLYDHCPKGVTKEDPHFLIVPEGDSGHCDGSNVTLRARTDMLKIAQDAMMVFKEQGYSTFIYLERNGSQLQGVQHKHGHVQGIRQLPRRFIDKCALLLRLIYPSTLSKHSLHERINHYQALFQHKYQQ